MKSTITSKGQTTIPRDIRRQLGIGTHDALEWRMEQGRAVVVPLRRRSFLSHRGEIKVGAGDINADIEKARAAQVEKYR